MQLNPWNLREPLYIQVHRLIHLPCHRTANIEFGDVGVFQSKDSRHRKISYQNIDIANCAELRDLTKDGMAVKKIQVTYDDTVSFSLTDSLEFKGFHFLDLEKMGFDVLMDSTEAETIDAYLDFYGRQLSAWLPRIFNEFGGLEEE